MPVARIISIQIAQPARVPRPEGELYTACGKTSVNGRVWVSPEGVQGDRQADRKNHGGPERAVLAYAAAHYPIWQAELDGQGGNSSLAWGAFGENFTVEGMEEASVAIGDQYECGALRLEVSYPREPCSKLGRFLQVHGLDHRIRASLRSGWFFRVLSAGWAETGQELVLQARPFPQWTIVRVSAIMYHGWRDPAQRAAIGALAGVEAFSWNWRKRFIQRAQEFRDS